MPGWEFYERRKIFYLRFPGDLLINMQKMMILPLIVSSVISSLATIKGKATGKMGLRAVVYYLSTSMCAVVIGVTLVMTIRPGERGDTGLSSDFTVQKKTPLDAILDLMRNCFPDNLVEACYQKQTTLIGNFSYQLPTTGLPAEKMIEAVSVVGSNGTVIGNGSYLLAASLTSGKMTSPVTVTRFPGHGGVTGISMKEDHVTEDPSVMKTTGINVLGLVVFSIFFGVIISNMRTAGRPLMEFFEALHQATLRMTMLIIWFSPIGIIFLIATKLVEIHNLSTIFIQLGFYILTVIGGLAFHAFITLPLVFFLITRKNPYVFMHKMTKALLTAWVTSSSLATLPVTLECLEVGNNVNANVAKFLVPIGATVNIEGAGVYDIIAPIFIAQINGWSLDVGQLITISLAAIVACIGTGLPTDILITTAVALTAGGLPLDDIGIIIAVDWILDRFCTPVNVLASGYGAAIVEHLSRDDLRDFDDAAAGRMLDEDL